MKGDKDFPFPRLTDTSPDIRKIQIEINRKRTIEERFQLLDEMNRAMRERIVAGVRAQFPDWSDEQVNEEVVRRMLGDQVYRKLKEDMAREPRRLFTDRSRRPRES